MDNVKPYEDDFAQLYDLLVYARDEVEADQVELGFLKWAFGAVARYGVKEVLDIGCGTGRHVVPLAREGYRVTGLDNSPGMLRQCEQRLQKHGLSAELVNRDLAQLDYEDRFDALICMDSGICNLLSADRIVDALRRFRKALRPGGLLVIDNWNLFAQWPRFGKTHTDTRTSGDIRIEYSDRHWLDDFTSVYHMDVVANVFEKGRRREVRHHDALRALTIGEMRVYLERAVFSSILVYPSFECRQEDRPTNADRMIFLALP